VTDTLHDVLGGLFECFYEKVVKSQGRRGGHPY